MQTGNTVVALRASSIVSDTSKVAKPGKNLAPSEKHPLKPTMGSCSPIFCRERLAIGGKSTEKMLSFLMNHFFR